jgi:cyclopropane fatty-acyl-phospholipid synthase-like methyltransferase
MVKKAVGDGNSASVDPREQELTLFANAISRHIDKKIKLVLEYGCGVGRLARKVLEKNKAIELIGVTDSPQQLNSALAFVNSERFEVLLPHELTRTVDLVYCTSILNHLPAVELRDALHRMHSSLKLGGKIIIFAPDIRRAVRFDKPEFFDDRCLGVNLRNEIQRFFEPKSALFTEQELAENPEIGIVLAPKPESEVQNAWLAQPALVYSRREFDGPAFNIPYRT